MRQKSLPALTHLHYLVLGVLRADEQPGRVLRQALAAFGVRRTAPAFYQLMARLEASKLVEGWYEQIVTGDQTVTERRYRITPQGSRAWSRARAFYTEVEQLASRVRWSDA
jgi:DNA-binding PadR family transcriptional regulator